MTRARGRERGLGVLPGFNHGVIAAAIVASLGLLQLGLLFVAYGTRTPGLAHAEGALDAISRGPGKYLVVPFFFPPVAFLLVMAAAQILAAHGSGALRSRGFRTSLGLVSMGAALAAFTVTQTDDVGVDRLVSDQYAAASPATNRLISACNPGSSCKGVVGQALQRVSEGLRAERGTISCPAHLKAPSLVAAAMRIDELAQWPISAPLPYAGISMDLATYYCATVIAPRKRLLADTLDRVELFVDALMALASVGLVCATWHLRLTRRATERVPAASFFLVIAAVLLLAWLPLADANVAWIKSFDHEICRISPRVLAPLYLMEIVALAALHAKKGAPALTAAVAASVVAAMNIVTFARPELVRDSLMIEGMGNFVLFVSGTVISMVVLMLVCVGVIRQLVDPLTPDSEETAARADRSG